MTSKKSLSSGSSGRNKEPPLNEEENLWTADALLKSGIAEFRAERNPAALLLLGAAESLFKDAGDTWNASIARQWLKSASKNNSNDS
jgi:hypothetical protein